jgi:hypothetical protein
LFGYYTYQEFLPEFQASTVGRREIMARFEGDPEKIRFYRGFKKHFDGDLNLKQLEQWLMDHPTKTLTTSVKPHCTQHYSACNQEYAEH